MIGPGRGSVNFAPPTDECNRIRKEPMSKFVVYKDTAGEWRWKLVTRNGRTIADSAEGYKRRLGAIDAAIRTQDTAANAEILEKE